MNQSKLYLSLSVLALLLLLTVLLKSFYAVSLFDLTFDILWIPTALLVLTMPLLNCVAIIKNTTEFNIYYWCGLLLNCFCLFLILKHFKLPIF